MVVDDLGIPSAFISLIFTLYYVHGKGQVTCCSKSYSVQSLGFRSINLRTILESIEHYRKWFIFRESVIEKGNICIFEPSKQFFPSTFYSLFPLSPSYVSAFSCSSNTMNLPYFIRECFGLLLSSLLCSLFYGLSSSIVACMICIIKSDTNKKGFNVIYTRGASYSYPSLCTFSIPFITSLFVGIRWLHHWERCLSWCIAICWKEDRCFRSWRWD